MTESCSALFVEREDLVLCTVLFGTEYSLCQDDILPS